MVDMPSDLELRLIALRDLGQQDTGIDRVDLRCRALLQREIDRELAPSSSWARRFRLRALALPASLLMAVGVGAAGYAALSTGASPDAGLECHLDGQLGGSGTITHLDGRSATSTCSQLWRQGAVDPRAHNAPGPLQACVARGGGGAVHVFASPTPAICAQLGMRYDPQAGTDPLAQRFGRFADQLTSQLQRPQYDCPNLSEVTRLVNVTMERSGLTGWTTKSLGTYDSAHPCASLAIDSDTQTVTISPVGR